MSKSFPEGFTKSSNDEFNFTNHEQQINKYQNKCPLSTNTTSEYIALNIIKSLLLLCENPILTPLNNQNFSESKNLNFTNTNQMCNITATDDTFKAKELLNVIHNVTLLSKIVIPSYISVEDCASHEQHVEQPTTGPLRSAAIDSAFTCANNITIHDTRASVSHNPHSKIIYEHEQQPTTDHDSISADIDLHYSSFISAYIYIFFFFIWF